MIFFILKAIVIFMILSPAAVAFGKFLDWHRKQSGQEITKDVLGDFYLKASYGTLFKDYCSYIISALSKLNFIAVYLIILASCFICAISINYFLFQDFKFREILFGRYAFLALVLSAIGLIDFAVTKKLLSLAVNGQYKFAAILSLISIYISSVGAGAFLSTFFLPFNGLDYLFYVNLFLNRFYVLMIDPLTSGLVITSSSGNYVSIIAFALPAIVISAFTLVVSAIVFLLSSKKLTSLYDYIAERLFSKEEKSIHLKLVTFICIIASALGSLISMLF